jgi:hypothetical protein
MDKNIPVSHLESQDYTISTEPESNPCQAVEQAEMALKQ